MNFLFEPVPNDKAVDFIQDKPVVTRDVFDKLLPEFKARAFTITGVVGADVMQSVRDAIATVPAGADWDKVKKEIVEEIHPFLADPKNPDNTIAAERKAELLLRMHGQQAYSYTQTQVADRHRDVFPYWQYQTMEDERVRDSHQALDGLVLPADSPFWEGHTPPWDYGCRCHRIPLMQSDVEDIQDDEKDLPADEQSVPDAAIRHTIEQGRMLKGGATIDIRTPEQKGETYHFNPDDLRLPISTIQSRYDAPVWHDFETWAKKTEISPGITVWHWLEGKPAVTAPAPIPASAPSKIRYQDLGSMISLFAKDPTNITTAEAKKIIEAIKNYQSHGADPDKWIKGVTGKNMSQAAVTEWEKTLRPIFEDFIKIIPKHILDTLPPINIQMKQLLYGAYGQFNEKERSVALNPDQLSGATAQLKSTLFHELMHWVHLTGSEDYKKLITDHFNQRTVGEGLKKMKLFGMVYGKQDKWWSAYMGRIYEGLPEGCEIPTRTFELLSNPKNFALRWNDPIHRETMSLVFSVLFDQPNPTP